MWSRYDPRHWFFWFGWFLFEHLRSGGDIKNGLIRLKAGTFVAKIPISELKQWEILTSIKNIRKEFKDWLEEKDTRETY